MTEAPHAIAVEQLLEQLDSGDAGLKPQQIKSRLAEVGVNRLPQPTGGATEIGINRMSQRNVVVQRLHSVEALASCTFIASDKTATLTLNEMTARIVAWPGEPPWKISLNAEQDSLQV